MVQSVDDAERPSSDRHSVRQRTRCALSEHSDVRRFVFYVEKSEGFIIKLSYITNTFLSFPTERRGHETRDMWSG